MTTKRRNFLKLAGTAGVGLAMTGASWLAWADKKSSAPPSNQTTSTLLANTGITGRVGVIGGGMAGATVAKYLRLWGGSGIEVTLIERSPYYTSSIMSNLVLNGSRSIDSLLFNWNRLVSNYGIKLIQGEVTNIDRYSKSVALADGRGFVFDRLVIAPGIDFDTLPGLEDPATQNLVPHAWKAGPQTTLLRQMITGIPNGGSFVMTIPPKPYRCPPGPYERACIVADWLKRNRSGAKVIVLDGNTEITAEAHTFTEAFNVTHAGVIEYYKGVTINSVDAGNKTISTNLGIATGNVLNVIPPHRAGKVISANGLADDATGKWTSVNVLSYESLKAPGIHVIGDSSATTQPKAGHIANQEAKVCADAIIRLMSGLQPDPAPVTNSACYSPITFETASWLTAVYAYDPTTKTMKITHQAPIEANRPSKDNFEEMGKWFTTLMADSYV
jgi:sulfide dehydrogenase [flavocytochrome c] flavoprotein subunit